VAQYSSLKLSKTLFNTYFIFKLVPKSTYVIYIPIYTFTPIVFQHRMKETLDSWLKVQAAWLYLEPIFGSEDIRNQIPVEGQMFVEVDGHWYDRIDVLIECLK